MFELTIRDPNSLLSVVVRQDIDETQVEQIRQILRNDSPDGEDHGAVVLATPVPADDRETGYWATAAIEGMEGRTKP